MGEGENGTLLTESVPTPAYHHELADYFEREEPELWTWFGESSSLAKQTDQAAEVALLKSAYRLDGGPHEVLTGYVSLLAPRLQIDEPVILYQSLGDTDRNARVVRLNGQVHVIFSGDLLDLLEPDEQHAVLAHELAHVSLWTRESGRYFALDHLVHRLANEMSAPEVIVETARRLRLHTEVWADAAAAVVVESVPATVAAIVKVSSGLRHVDADAYLRQAAQILELDDGASQAWTHPELHIRVACIEGRKRGTASSLIDAIVSGPDDLDRLDLLGQARVRALTARVVRSAISAAGNSDGATTYARGYPDLAVKEAAPLSDDELATHEPSIRWMAGAILVDVALADGSTDSMDELRAVSRNAERIGVGKEFDKILAKATDQTAKEAAALRKGNS